MPEQTYRTTYDKETNVLYVYLKEDKRIEITRPVRANVYIDYDSNKEKVGIEILLNEPKINESESFNETKIDNN